MSETAIDQEAPDSTTQTTTNLTDPDAAPSTSSYPPEHPLFPEISFDACTSPDDFPSVCTVVLQEGKEIDYIARHGFCSILGVVRTDSSPPGKIIISRKASLPYAVGNQNIHLQFYSEGLGLYRWPSNSPQNLYIRLDLEILPGGSIVSAANRNSS